MWNPLHICSGHLAIVLLTRSTISLQLCQILAISLQLWQLLAISLQLLAISLQFGVRQVGHYPERQTNKQVANFHMVSRYSEILDSGPKHKYNSTLYLPYSSSDTSDNLSDENSGGLLTLSSQDVRKIETSIRGHKSRIYVCKCMANLYSCPKLNLCHEDYSKR